MITEEVFTLETLCSMNGGKYGRLINNQLKRLAADCFDRPADDRPREVTVTIRAVPNCGDDGNADTVSAKVVVKAKVPQYQTQPFELRLTEGKTGLSINVGDPSNIRQHTMFPPDTTTTAKGE